MKKLHFFFFLLCFAACCYGQAPQSVNFQATLRDAAGTIIPNTSISVKMSILQGSPSGTLVYQETHTYVMTNLVGLFALQIGQGSAVVGTFASINWLNGAKYIKVEIDTSSPIGTNYTLQILSQFLSVPYALYAENSNMGAGTGISISGNTISNSAPDQLITLTGLGSTTVTGTYPNFSITSTAAATYIAGTGISISGTTITNTAPDQTVSLTGIGATSITGTYPNFTITSTDNVNDADADPANEIQSLALSGNSLSITGGNTIILPAAPVYTAGTGIAILGTTITNTSPNQPITLTGIGATSVMGTYPNFTITSTDNVNDADADPTNEIQNLLISGNSLSIVGGNTVTLPTAPVYTAGTGIAILGGVVSNIGDNDATDDITTSTAAGGDVLGNYPNLSVVGLQNFPISNLAPGYGQVLKFDGTNWYPDNDLTGFAPWQTINGSDIFYLYGNVGIGTSYPTHKLHLAGVDDALRIEGTQAPYMYGGKINFGDANYAYIQESQDDMLEIYGGAGLLLNGYNTDINGYLNVYYGGYFNGSLQANGTGYFNYLDVNGGGSFDGNVYGYPYGSGSTAYSLYASVNYGGIIEARGPSSANVSLTSSSSNVNLGYVAVWDGSSSLQAGIYINGSNQGVVFGDIKNFVADHPTDTTKSIWYACVEGPEAASYTRGTAKLVNGKSIIALPEHFRWVSTDINMTVLVTPLSGDSKGLAVINKNAMGFEVVELLQGTGNYEFDWEVKAVRKNFEEYRVIRDKSEYAPVKGETKHERQLPSPIKQKQPVQK